MGVKPQKPRAAKVNYSLQAWIHVFVLKHFCRPRWFRKIVNCKLQVTNELESLEIIKYKFWNSWRLCMASNAKAKSNHLNVETLLIYHCWHCSNFLRNHHAAEGVLSCNHMSYDWRTRRGRISDKTGDFIKKFEKISKFR